MNATLLQMRLETERLIIRPYIESDLTASFELMQNPEVLAFMHMDMMPLHEYEGLFRWLMFSYHTPFELPFKYSFAICSRGTGRLVGWCGAGVLDFSVPDTELYYLIGREHWGRGYATEAAVALAGYAFNVIGLQRLYAKADPRNTASLGVFKKLGFRFERELAGLTGDYADCNGELLHVLQKEQFLERFRRPEISGSE
ncbi:GNAT family N-acetyltransferase [Paenibacillus sp. MMS20-IR301]|uniref:GNAT family N-acetyltransferase n=1 Tax=Paenibacillus sp. MMS20-IR301 TaxID=2895946 RepID=UPI0028EE0400|nr:GNAT family N-acetyltransferase [Paenibacillus sp. MMS20-IR301]WNS42369.1 GNAT family N-acetyltransferase [Paenibacillus sp. MMS20-IR301]